MYHEQVSLSIKVPVICNCVCASVVRMFCCLNMVRPPRSELRRHSNKGYQSNRLDVGRRIGSKPGIVLISRGTLEQRIDERSG